MIYYKCKKGLTWFSYKGKRRKFATNQLIKIDEVSDAPLLNIVNGHPNFEKTEVEEVLHQMVPHVDQLLDVPEATQYMSRESIIQEIYSYGVRPDVYDMDETLSQQLKTLRIMTKKNFVTVVTKSGKPVYVQNINDFMKEYRSNGQKNADEECLGEYTQKLKEQKAKVIIPIVKEEDYAEQKSLKEGVTVMAIEKDSDELNSGKTFEQVVDDLSKEEMQLKQRDLVKGVSQKGILMDELPPEHLKFPEEKLKINNFRYLVEIDKTVKFADEFTDEERENCRSVDWMRIPQIVVDAYLYYRGVNIREMYDNSHNVASIRNQKIEKMRELIVEDIKTKGDLPYIEINVFWKRLLEIQKFEPAKWRTLSSASLAVKYSMIKKYILGVKPRVSSKKKTKDDIREFDKTARLLYEIAKYGLSIPTNYNSDILKDILYTKGFDTKRQP